ncbi:MAG: adenylate/guanylate cyclase domain-containing protein [Planctomycetales bacterium]|nr:adenylate/guanylate cyclase domain-containing protein [Planctomycetales bacterium]
MIDVNRCDMTQSMVPLLPSELFEFLESENSNDDACSGPAPETVAKWLSNTGQLHRAAAGSPEFYADAARFAVDTVGLDAAWVLSLMDNDWRIVGACLPRSDFGISFNRAALRLLEQQHITWYQSNTKDSHPALVVAPVLDLHKNLTAAVYGVRHTVGENRRRGIRPLEARLVQLLADSVAVGIARLERETETARSRVLLEQAFSPKVADYLQQHPESLTGQLKEVTLLFADLRGFTSLAERISPDECYRLLGDVMESLTQIVMKHGGVVVDYYGDGLLALWNAPLEQTYHPDLACTAALQLLEAVPGLTLKWQPQLNAPLELGIGIHTGPAHVGNAGTRSRLKYGPRGNTVNIASRVQAASKQLQLPLVITSATQAQLTEKFFSLRTCTAKLPGLEQPIDLYTVYSASTAQRMMSNLDQYVHALELFEAGNLESAEKLLRDLAETGHNTPAHFLANYTAAQLNGNQGRRAVDKYAVQQGSVIEILGK